MKFLLITSFLFFVFYNCSAQLNLVPNGNFELYTTCPNNSAAFNSTPPWSSCSFSPDYFNACADNLTTAVSVPYNMHGYQTDANNGGGYYGIILWSYDENLPFFHGRETMGVSLTSPMIIGTKYYVSFLATLSIDNFQNCCASDKIGALFSTVSFSAVTKPSPIHNFAHVYSNVVITDTVNWTRVSGSFVADSAYNFITIGNFFEGSNLNIIDFKNNQPTTIAVYYFIDEVKVSTDSLFVNTSLKKQVKEEKLIAAFPNPTLNEINLMGIRENTKVSIYNSSGLFLKFGEVKNDKIDISDLPAGLYLIRINEFDSYKKTFKIQKL